MVETEKEYEKLLDLAYAQFPANVLEKKRFEIPRVDSAVQGKKTVIHNFSQIAKDIGRDIKHLYKFFTKETATSLLLTEPRLTLNGRFSQQALQGIVNKYVKEFVLCPMCDRPDTKMVEQQGVKVLKCDACGAMNPLRRF